VFSAHGLEPSLIPRFFRERRAPFSITLTDLQSDSKLLAWLSGEKLAWIADEFLISQEWLDGVEERIHQYQFYDRNPRKFYSTVKNHLDRSAQNAGGPIAFFIRWGLGRDWSKRHQSRVFVVIAIPIAQFGSERTIYQYISDHQPYPWEPGRTKVQLRAWARLLHHTLGPFFIFGRETSTQNGGRLYSNSVFLHEFVWNHDIVMPTRDDWTPEDYAYGTNESAVSKEADTLPEVLAFLHKHGLSTEP
jgi:hypothetical protein